MDERERPMLEDMLQAIGDAAAPLQTLPNEVVVFDGRVVDAAPMDLLQERADDPIVSSDLQDLVIRASQQDRDAFGSLFEAYKDIIYRFLLFKVGDSVLAEDLLQDTFVKALVNIDKYEWRGLPLEHWLIKIARNVTVDHWRTDKSQREQDIDPMFDLHDTNKPPDERVMAGLEVEALSEALVNLPDDRREVVILRFIEGYPNADVANVLGKSTSAVRQLQMRALNQLKGLMRGRKGSDIIKHEPKKRPTLGETAIFISPGSDLETGYEDEGIEPASASDPISTVGQRDDIRGMTYKDIADMLGVTPDAITSHVRMREIGGDLALSSNFGKRHGKGYWLRYFIPDEVAAIEASFISRNKRSKKSSV